MDEVEEVEIEVEVEVASGGKQRKLSRFGLAAGDKIVGVGSTSGVDKILRFDEKI